MYPILAKEFDASKRVGAYFPDFKYKDHYRIELTFDGDVDLDQVQTTLSAPGVDVYFQVQLAARDMITIDVDLVMATDRIAEENFSSFQDLVEFVNGIKNQGVEFNVIQY